MNRNLRFANRLFLNSSLLFAATIAPFVCGADPASSDGKWDRFRGENGLGVLAKCQVQIPWKESQVKSIAIPGTGHGSVALSGGMAFLLSADSKDATRHVVAVDIAKNAIAWTKSYPSVTHKLHKFSSYASSTPCTDGERVYVAWADPENVVVKALTHSGDEVWTRSLGRYVSQHGFGTSPMLVDGKLILLNSQDAMELPAGVDPLTLPIIVLVDEIDAHLHPAWQRKILHIAERLLPNAQIIVSTHSPFVVQGANDPRVIKPESVDTRPMATQTSRLLGRHSLPKEPSS